ncbi:MAG: N-acetylglucosamine kinase [Bacteroidetes bacterium]|nr:N-acetylglucosamine kinase [Bacteroidota bacterium]
MLLIADSGSTKTHWVLVDKNNNKSNYHTIGYNPFFIDSKKIYESLSESLTSQFDAGLVSKIFFYGAGCSSPENVNTIQTALVKAFPKAKIVIGHDLLAAARALLGDERGFATIIGTGSNTCIYDGKGIEKNIDSLGYLLGDEGSGCYIGKKILRDFMRDFLPADLHKKFNEKYHLTHSDIFDAMYNRPLPNRFLASFALFAQENKTHTHIQQIIKESFNDFFKHLVSRYPGYSDLSFNCVGSVGFVFQDILKEVATSYNMKIGELVRSPIEGLVDYHLK